MLIELKVYAKTVQNRVCLTYKYKDNQFLFKINGFRLKIYFSNNFFVQKMRVSGEQSGKRHISIILTMAEGPWGPYKMFYFYNSYVFIKERHLFLGNVSYFDFLWCLSYILAPSIVVILYTAIFLDFGGRGHSCG